jgi:hypothetical protein
MDRPVSALVLGLASETEWTGMSNRFRRRSQTARAPPLQQNVLKT